MDIKDKLALTLYRIYDSEIFTPIMEFLQGETRVLLYLHMNEGKEIYPSNLSDSLHVTRQRITSILSVLRKKGFVVMELSEKDRRRIQVFLTQQGSEYIIAKEKIAEEQIDNMIKILGNDKVKELYEILEILLPKNTK